MKEKLIKRLYNYWACTDEDTFYSLSKLGSVE